MEFEEKVCFVLVERRRVLSVGEGFLHGEEEGRRSEYSAREGREHELPLAAKGLEEGERRRGKVDKVFDLLAAHLHGDVVVVA